MMIGLMACQTARQPTAPIASPGGHLREGWLRPLVHSEVQPFYVQDLAVSRQNREEFDNLVGVILQALQALRLVEVPPVSLGDYLDDANRNIRQQEGNVEGHVVYHTRRDLDGNFIAEGLTLSLGREAERDLDRRYLNSIHVRLEDKAVDGDVDGQIDSLQFVIDTNSAALGAIEVFIEHVDSSVGENLFDFTISRLYDSSPTSREGSVVYRGAETTEVVDWISLYLWDPLRGESYTQMVANDPTGSLFPGQVFRLPRQPWDTPASTNFPNPPSAE